MPTRLLVATPQPYDVTLALRDAGYEVIYVGEQAPDALISAAQQEDVAAIVVPVGSAELTDCGLPVVEAAGKDIADVLAQLP